jgi:hypothetical protein
MGEHGATSSGTPLPTEICPTEGRLPCLEEGE